MEKLAEIQQKLKAPKDMRNTFGNYNYRSAESILESVKPLLGDAVLTLSDDVVLVGERFYIKATATFEHGDFVKSVTAFAREPEDKKGMDDSQITGTASSYARKYALNGLFAIDDAKDSDTDEHHIEIQARAKSEEIKVSSLDDIISGINEKMTIDNARAFYAKAISLYGKDTKEYKQWVKVWADKKDSLEKQANENMLNEAAEFLNNI